MIIILEVPNERKHSLECISNIICFFTIYYNEYAYFIFWQTCGIEK
jgi:hypothetical protein